MKHTLIFFAMFFAVSVTAQSPAKKQQPRKTCAFIMPTSEYCGKPAAPKCANRCESHGMERQRKQAAYGRMRRAKKH